MVFHTLMSRFYTKGEPELSSLIEDITPYYSLVYMGPGASLLDLSANPMSPFTSTKWQSSVPCYLVANVIPEAEDLNCRRR